MIRSAPTWDLPVSLFQRYGKNGGNDKLKTWANQTLPTLQHHLDMAQDIYGKM